ncbi:unnamed protein product [Ranitomeya imitator]|uniref:Kinesin-like protein n=1 Tax=Ranitomeya imitator TaxID=111125 RepID=A0ABN9MQ29_9NEOB|nr:unnamed protein product [Ranitomeya imitator]
MANSVEEFKRGLDVFLEQNNIKASVNTALMDVREDGAALSAEQSALLDPSMCSTAGDMLISDCSALVQHKASFTPDFSFLLKNQSSWFSGSLRVLSSQASHPLKVFLRVRPFSKAELSNHESQDCVSIENTEVVSLHAPKDSSTMKNCERGIGQAVHKFTFTRIFGEDTTQADFFEGTMKDLVVSFANGQNGLVFTYGVTNAGKTFTIQGTPKDGGILPRSLDVVFDHMKGRHYEKMNLKPYLGNDVMMLDAAQDSMKTVLNTGNLRSLVCEDALLDDQGGNEQRQFSAWVSFFEIYNEYVYDLLDQLPSSKNQKRAALKICDDQLGTSYVKDLKWFNITSTEEACKILQIGNKNRSLASTKMNQQSSRSHSIFTIRLLQLSHGDDPSVLGVSEMSLCDLAGSERCNKTQTVGDRLKEAGNINNSLLILGKCIAALKHSQNPKKASYVPFRESKLTRLFQPFFCGKGKACMIVNINQCASTYDETLHVMKFSAVAKQGYGAHTAKYCVGSVIYRVAMLNFH